MLRDSRPANGHRVRSSSFLHRDLTGVIVQGAFGAVSPNATLRPLTITRGPPRAARSGIFCSGRHFAEELEKLGMDIGSR